MKNNLKKGFTDEDKQLIYKVHKESEGQPNLAYRLLRNESVYGTRFSSISAPTIQRIWAEKKLKTSPAPIGGRKSIIESNGKGYLTPAEEQDVLKQFRKMVDERYVVGRQMYKIIGDSLHTPKSATIIELYLACQGLVEMKGKKAGGLEKKVR